MNYLISNNLITVRKLVRNVNFVGKLEICEYLYMYI